MGYLGVIIASYALLNYKESEVLSQKNEFFVLSIFLFIADYISVLSKDYIATKVLAIIVFFFISIYFLETALLQLTILINSFETVITVHWRKELSYAIAAILSSVVNIGVGAKAPNVPIEECLDL